MKSLRVLGFLCFASALTACGLPVASMLGSTGLVSESQAKGFLDAGDKLAKSQEELTSEQEYYLGRAVAAQILAKHPPVADTNLNAYVNRVGNVLARASDFPETFKGYRFVIVESPTINAMAAPSGFVFVTRGFLKLLPNEDALAAVLAHEIAHVVKRHGVNAISNANLFGALAQVGQQGINVAASEAIGAGGVDLGPITNIFAESVAGVADKLLTTGFDRKQEYAADEYAVVLLQRVGYDPKAVGMVLKILKAQKGTEGGWFETHPDPADRLEEVEDALEDDEAAPASGVTTREARFKRSVPG
jgi:beta-barrel assembly-enhancing protease